MHCGCVSVTVPVWVHVDNFSQNIFPITKTYRLFNVCLRLLKANNSYYHFIRGTKHFVLLYI